MSEKILEEKFKNAGRISIRPNFNPKVPNMGLENYGMVIMPGTKQREPMACIEEHGQIRYLNGLDEAAPEVKSIKDPEKKAARIKEIRSIVAMLEFKSNYNKIEIDDPDFWNKVQTYKPNNREIWSKVVVECDNNTQPLDPINNTDHLLIALGIEAGGFPIIAKSKDDAGSGVQKRKWYLDRQIESAKSNASVTKIKNKALAKLDEIAEETPRKLFYIIKLISPNSMMYKDSTFIDMIYDDLDEYINGEGNEPSITKAAKQFITYSELDMKELKIRAMVKDATFYKFIILKGDGMMYYAKENVMLGRNSSEIYEYMNNPLNEDMLVRLQDDVEGMWSIK